MKTIRLLQGIVYKKHDSLSIYLSLFYSNKTVQSCMRPIDGVFLLKKSSFELILVFKDKHNKNLDSFQTSTDQYGILETTFKEQTTPSIQHCSQIEVKNSENSKVITTLKVQVAQESGRIVICDFDKTLMETSYTSVKEITSHLFSKLNDKKIIRKSVQLLQKFISEGHNAFILSASPHFYAPVILKWLVHHKINISGFFFKDYRTLLDKQRHEFSLSQLFNQSYYKLINITKILLLTGIPQELVLIGDDFEQDHHIYLWLKKTLEGARDYKLPTELKLTIKQEQEITNSLKIITNNQSVSNKEITIYIRTTKPIGKDGLNIHTVNEINYYL